MWPNLVIEIITQHNMFLLLLNWLNASCGAAALVMEHIMRKFCNDSIGWHVEVIELVVEKEKKKTGGRLVMRWNGRAPLHTQSSVRNHIAVSGEISA